MVVGSVNVDLIALVARLPGPGETVTGGAFERHGGGKSANQAVAAARMGARVRFVGAVGDDEAGRSALSGLRAEGVHTDGVVRLAGMATEPLDAGDADDTLQPGTSAWELVGR